MSYALATISNPSAALTDFSLIVDLSRMPADWWTAVDTTDGTRGRVFKGDGETRLAADWIDFDDTAETGLLRVKWTGTLATTGTQELWIEPPIDDDNTNPTVAANATYGSDNAYDADWDGYWPDGGGTDRTSNGNNGTANGGVTVGGATGKIGAATDFDGTDDYVEVGYNTSNQDYTWSFWANPDVVRRTWIINADITSSGWSIGNFTDGGELRVYSGTTTTRWIGQAGQLTDTWQRFDVTFSGGVQEVYKDASALTASSDNSGATISGGSSVYIGGIWIDGWNYFDGLLNEVQIHSVQRSADWISSEYDQTSDQATFWGTWSWESDTGDALTADLADSVGVTDALSADRILGRSITDTAGVSDALEATLAYARLLSDTAGISDALTTARTLARSIDDTAGLTDIVTRSLAAARAIDDSVGVTDSLTAQIAAALIEASISDTVGVSDNIDTDVVAFIVASISDTVGLTDALAQTRAIHRIVADTAGVSDITATARAISRLLDDIAGTTDSVTVSRAISRLLADTAGLTDTMDATVARMVAAAIADSVGVIDGLQTIIYTDAVTMPLITLAPRAITRTTTLAPDGITRTITLGGQ